MSLNGQHSSINAQETVMSTTENDETQSPDGTANDKPGLTSLLTLTAYEGEYWAKLEVECIYSSSGDTFTCQAKRYQARANNVESGNVLLEFSEDGKWDETQLSRDDAVQDGAWHDISGGGTVTAKAYYAMIKFHYIYDRSGVSDVHLRTSDVVFFVPQPPQINPISVVPQRAFDVTGRGMPGATVSIFNLAGALQGSRLVGSDGLWSIRVTMASSATSITFYATQRAPNNEVSARTSNVTVTLMIASVEITSPKANDIITTPKPTVSGKGQNNATIKVYQADFGSVLYGTGIVQDGIWNIPLTESLPNGRFVFHVLQDFSGTQTWSEKVPVTVQLQPDRPVIYSPDPGSEQNSTFRLGGTGGVAGALMEAFLDLNHSVKVGQAWVTGDNWSVEVSVEPGRRSLVVRQTKDSIPSVFSLPRSFDIRPPALTKVKVTFPSAAIVKFEGDGYEDATVEMTVVSGTGGSAPGEAKVVGGKWETSATNWPNGLYKMSAIQKVSNNAGGWIKSAPFPFQFPYEFQRPYGVTATPEYWTTFSGKGVSAATVSLYDSDGTTKIAPDAQVNSGQWSSRAYAEWGPTYDRIVRLRQSLNAQQSDFVEYKVRIPPIAPGIDRVPPEGLSPTFTGTCELNARVNLVFSGSDTSYPATVTGRTWTCQRAEPFAPEIDHTVTATQIAAQQTSPAATETFRLFKPMIAPVITLPVKYSEVGRDVIFQGTDGMSGATVYLWDYLSGAPLGSKKLTADGVWELPVEKLKFGRWVVRAKQVINDRESADSESHSFDVVLLAPDFISPQEGGRLTRTSMIEGKGEPLGTVDVFLEGTAEPLLKQLPTGLDGKWKGEVTLPVGHKIIRARQYFEDQTSKDSVPVNYSVVPAPPVLETPVPMAHVGQGTVASGFGVPGDKIIVWMIRVGAVRAGETTVQADGTWSVAMNVTQPSRVNYLVVTASSDDFRSDGTAERAVILGTYRPVFKQPAEGQSVSDPVRFAGEGRAGDMQVRSWFNPEQEWAQATVSGGNWQGDATKTLPIGGQWCWIQQTITDDAGGATISDHVLSPRFEVHPASPGRTPSDHSDKRRA
jgi:hypothetical protein